MTIHRRSALKGLAATGTGIFGAPAILCAGIEPIRIGFLTVKTGPLASGGIQMEEGLTLYLKERDSTLCGRPVQLFTADTGGVPALTKSKAQELVERAKVHCFIGPLAAFEALAIDDYIRETQDTDDERSRSRRHDSAQAKSLVCTCHVVILTMREPDG